MLRLPAQDTTPLSRSERIALFIIIALAAVLRFYHLTAQGLSNDELSALMRLNYGSLGELIEKGVKPDGHPAGIQVFEYFWIRWFGMDEWTVRFPFVIMGLLALPVCFVWVRAWFGSRTALLTVATLALLEHTTLYGTFARPYAAGLLFSMLAVLAWTRIIQKEKPSWTAYAGFAISAAACAYIHYFSFLFVLILGATGLLFLRGRKLWIYIAAGLAAIVLYLPHIPVLQAHLKLGGLLWLGPPGKDWLWYYIQVVFNNSWLVLGGLVVVIIAGRMMAPVPRPLHLQAKVLSLALFLLPFIIGYLKSISGKPVLQPSILLFSLPFLPAFLFSFTESLTPPGRKFYVLLALWCGLLLGSLALEKQYYTREQYAPFKKPAQEIDALNNRYGQDNIARFISLNNPGYIHYYLPKRGDTDFYMYRYDDMKQIDTMFRIIRGLRQPYLLDAWSNIAHPDIIEPIIRLKYPRLVQNIPHFNAGIKLFSRDMPQKDTAVVILPLDSFVIPSPGDKMATYTTNFRQEYSGRIVRLSGKFLLKGEPDKMEWVLSVEDKDKKVYSWNTYRPEEMDPEFQGWRDFVWFIKLPESKSPEDIMKIYIWEYKPEALEIMDLRLEVY